MYFMKYDQEMPDYRIIRGLATAGLIGNIVKSNGSISGAEVGCQGELGTACAMAAGAATQIWGGTPRQIEYAAEMGFEHNLGTDLRSCDGIRTDPLYRTECFCSSKGSGSCFVRPVFRRSAHGFFRRCGEDDDGNREGYAGQIPGNQFGRISSCMLEGAKPYAPEK